MFSKEESRKLREEFWISFGKSYPRKWIMYKTKIKGLSFKFHFDTKKAMVSIDVEGELEQRIQLWEKLESLKSILINEFLPNAIFEDCFILENQKEISRIYISLNDVSIHNKNTWLQTMQFLSKKMIKMEEFFINYKDILQP
ncbi:DUF4268 domain-containing protein [Maribacter cobaltidurans]|uniref:DUF4268 domain-containing protein n=1 Tax=Maribacter cobaltidurans TaxID=1178778 RepID=A0A223V0X6_9FLAO|nr:DUF4268 domain-containing protein [Maribacter cobaltidurans]ASV28956.1 hypothetical protein CJ263_01195 [Maribacter cobaltidurans]GGD73355.1 hypothetical protein GCM10011412_08790 [Maribacter cobaltidurans]